MDVASYGIRVNALMPGVIDTPMPARSLKRYADPEAMRAYWKERHPLGRIGQPDDVASAVAFLASERARFVTELGVLEVANGEIAIIPRGLRFRVELPDAVFTSWDNIADAVRHAMAHPVATPIKPTSAAESAAATNSAAQICTVWP